MLILLKGWVEKKILFLFYNTPLQEVITLLGTSLHNRKYRQGTASCKAPTLANRTGKITVML